MASNQVDQAKRIATHFIEALREALDAINKHGDMATIAQGKVFESAGLMQTAIECYCTPAKTGEMEALARLALCQIKAGQAEAALDTATKLTALDSKFACSALATGEVVSAMAILGDALVLADQEEPALAAYKAALNTDANQSYAAGRLASLLLAKGQTAEAVKLAPAIGRNLRFDDVQALLRLSASNAAATPSVSFERVQSLLRVAVPGRPFVISGEPRVAGSATDSSWSADARIEAGDLPSSTRQALGKAWEKTGRDEHASIASFARFILELLSLGAPASLVSAATRAMSDEVRHATSAFDAASSFSGRPVGVGPLSMVDVCIRERKEDIVRALFAEGCVGETIASEQAKQAAIACDHEGMRKMLLGVARDEAHHAELAWASLEWIMSTQPSLIGVMREQLQEIERGWPAIPVSVPAFPAGYGQLSEQAAWMIAERVFHGEICPRAEAMFLGAVIPNVESGKSTLEMTANA
ncbi:tetratricopeptide repeat protein [Ralstonia pseudosolanacearum]|uniref:Tetratricopeptide repeat protein n=1 Tax=Ralstonia solanacearum TaxID=305 RepID=A0AA92QDD9_RALSL|nr:hypothetical protein [Ralstonia pseudosolanacearum]QOK94277.1 hypothetical protein HF908_23025 [Ralstonia pseudosolanacearum]QOK99017.1 hypothetical protein HF909_21790 [Ralstonia pseudosolanacearum]UWD89247.1 hypothetical protein NY025_03800 [Ralstonia pseudosolanacearum]CAH0445638.1 hypothetical protein LMG9673_04671 [Ralstonia pseudosolanacearum]